MGPPERPVPTPPYADSVWPYIVAAPLFLIVGVAILANVVWLVALVWLILQELAKILLVVLEWVSVVVWSLATVLWLLCWAPVEILHVIYWELGGRRVYRPPRYDIRGDSLAKSDLCERCKQVIQSSRLFAGSWTLFVRAIEWHPFYATAEGLRDSSVNCSLCYKFVNSTSRPSETDDSAVAPADLVKSGEFLIKIWVASSLKPSSNCLQLYHSDKAVSGVLRTGEGPRKKSPVREHTGSSSSMTKAKEWIQSCSQHPECASVSPASGFRPTRLLEVGTSKRPTLRLIEKPSAVSDEPVTYLALSHCWGGGIEASLKEDRLEKMKEAIDMDALPRNFQDAIQVTRQLDVPYLWIDSLCIIQDDKADWAKEAMRMADVYSHALCTIAATASASSDQGCFRPRSQPVFRSTLISSGKSELYIEMKASTVQSQFEMMVEPAPLNKRAWVFQERLLSRRVLHFCSDALLFECRAKRASEWNSFGVGYELRTGVQARPRQHAASSEQQPLLGGAGAGPITVTTSPRSVGQKFAHDGIRGALDFLLSFAASTSVPAPSSQDIKAKIEFNRRWYELVEAYTSCALKEPSDRLVALAGIAQVIAGATGRSVADPYISGLWISRSHGSESESGWRGLWYSVSLEFGLLWRAKRPQPVPSQPPDWAPSWSWATVNGPVEHLLQGLHVRMEESVTFHAAVEGTAKYDGIGGGEVWLEIAGPARVRKYSRRSSPDYFPDWFYSPSQDLKEDLIELHILTVFGESYGLVLRLVLGNASPTEYQRVGVFKVASTGTETQALKRSTFRVV